MKCVFHKENAKPPGENLVAFLVEKIERKWYNLCRCRYGNPKKRSSFICLKCLQIGIPGIQRKSQREKFHIKTLFCCNCQTETKHIEIRHCDWIEEIKDKAEKLHIELYGKVG